MYKVNAKLNTSQRKDLSKRTDIYFIRNFLVQWKHFENSQYKLWKKCELEHVLV